MHFYCFMPSFVSILNRRQRRRTRKLYMIVTVVISYFCVFLRLMWFYLSTDFTDFTDLIICVISVTVDFYHPISRITQIIRALRVLRWPFFYSFDIPPSIGMKSTAAPANANITTPVDTAISTAIAPANTVFTPMPLLPFAVSSSGLKVDEIETGLIVLVVVIIFFLATKDAQLVFDCAYADVCVHVNVDSLHLWRMELQQAKLGVYAIVRRKHHHVAIEV